MSLNKTAKKAREFAKPYCVTRGLKFRLKDVDPGSTGGLKMEQASSERALNEGIEALSKLQERLYAEDRQSALFVLQAMDAAGKDGVIRHVMSGINPQGCQVSSFKAPSPEELDHDFLWRCHKQLPERGRIGIFNRSYYEEVLVVRVHPEFLLQQKLPAKSIKDKNIWKQRFEDIRAFEQYITRNGTAVRKFFLHISRDEQKRRFLARLDDPEKQWKFSVGDVAERMHWKEYMKAYEDMIRHTATPEAPWYVIPADNKAFARLVVAAAMVETLAGLHPEYPAITAEASKAVQAGKAALLAE